MAQYPTISPVSPEGVHTLRSTLYPAVHTLLRNSVLFLSVFTHHSQGNGFILKGPIPSHFQLQILF